MNKSDEFRTLCYPNEADCPDPNSGAKAVLGVGLKFLIINIILFALIDNTVMGFASAAGIICAILIICRVSYCREVLICHYILSALPQIGYCIWLAVKAFGKSAETSLGGWVWLFTALGKIFSIAFPIILAVVWVSEMISAYIDLFENRDVNSYIESKKNNGFYM